MMQSIDFLIRPDGTLDWERGIGDYINEFPSRVREILDANHQLDPTRPVPSTAYVYENDDGYHSVIVVTHRASFTYHGRFER